jgi:hypothetical protein
MIFVVNSVNMDSGWGTSECSVSASEVMVGKGKKGQVLRFFKAKKARML